jgi:AraC-like DNA-binding protein
LRSQAAVFAPYKLFALIEVAKEFGVPASHILRGTGLDLKALEDAKTRTTVEQYVTACANAIKHCNDPLLPFRVGKNIHLAAYGLYGFALLCSPTVRDGFNLAVRYHGLATPIFSIDWRAQEDHFIWFFPNEFRVRYTSAVKQFLLAQQLAQHITHIQDIARSDRKPLLIKIAHSPPIAARLYGDQLGCPVEFSSEATEIHYDQSLLDDRPPLTNPVTLAMLRESCENLIGRIGDDSSTVSQVTQCIMERPGQFPTMETVAGHMNLTPRTLRRRLEGEGTTFSQVFDKVRRDLAEKYLSAGDFTVEDIAELLGFTDASNFRHSFKRWTGIVPREFKLRSAMIKK